MPGDALDSEYENGIADILGYLARDFAVVDRNVHLHGRKSHQQRQIDVKVTGKIFGLDNATMIVDCKRYKSRIDVNHVGAFVALVEDVGADIGLLVTTAGASEAARQLAKNTRGDVSRVPFSVPNVESITVVATKITPGAPMRRCAMSAATSFE